MRLSRSPELIPATIDSSTRAGVAVDRWGRVPVSGSTVTTWVTVSCCGMGRPFAGCRPGGSTAAGDRVVGAEEVLRVVLRLDRLESLIGVGGVEARGVGRPLGEVEVLAAGLVGREGLGEQIEPLAVGPVRLVVEDQADAER